MPKEVILIGGGGHSSAVIDVIEAQNRYKINAIFDENPKKIGTLICGYEIKYSTHNFEQMLAESRYFVITIGQIKTPEPRIHWFEKLKSLGAKFPIIISPFAHVSSHANVAEGSVVMHGAIVNARASVGKNCIINSKALVEHDVKIGAHSHVSTSAVVNGNCVVGRKVFIGSNAVLKQGVRIADECIVAMGTKIFEDINSIGTVFN